MLENQLCLIVCLTQKRNRQIFLGTDTTYQRARSIDVGASDSRRVFGMDHESYILLNHPFKIQEDTGNANAFFANLRYYRMYRRLGLNVRIETGGSDLATRNLVLIVLRMRYGGQMELTAAGAFSNSWQA